MIVGHVLGSYTISAKLGAGGMGEVYRAHDARLDRDVAIKILPPTLAADPVALARFEREAKAVAALSHPNILAIHDFGKDGDTVFAVMELLEGDTLRERLAGGALPIRKAIEIAVQIVHGLAAAHAKGIVHRDLKPDNVFVDPHGHVKILDFGLAKAVAVDSGQTMAATKEGTSPGTVVGTVGYMSPEQVRGAAVDHRTDIFAFGAIVYEMLSGRRAFRRDSSAETIAAILKEDVPELTPASGVPPSLERIVRRCLEKNPGERFHSAHDLGIALEAFTERSSTTTLAAVPDGSRKPSRAAIAASAVAALAVIALAGVISSGRFTSGAAAVPLRKLQVPAQRLVPLRESRPTISPDGEKIVFVAGDTLWIQELNQLDPKQIATSWRPAHLFWSPDSRFVGFVSEQKLWKVSIAGGAPIALADVATTGGGALGTWHPDGKIVFSRSTGGAGLLEVSQDGGELRPIVPLQESDVDFHEPALLPGGNGILFVVHGAKGPDTIEVFDETRKQVLSLPGEQILFPQYSATGHIVFNRLGKTDGVWALPFDLSRLEKTGEPFLIAPGAFFPSLSAEGTLTFFRRVWSEPRQLVVLNRAGGVERAIGEPQSRLSAPVLAPDGRRVVVSLGANARDDLWIYDVEKGSRTRLTFLESPAVIPAAWTGGNRVVYQYTVPARLRFALASHPADGRGDAEQLGDGFSPSVSNSAAVVVFANMNDAKQADIDLYYRGPGDAAAKPFLERAGEQNVPQLSPDGAYVAYQSNESGRFEVYVRPFPAGAGQWQVSVSGGGEPRWSAKGDKLWFRAYGNVLMEADVTAGPTFDVSEPREVFKGDPIAVDLLLGYAAIGNGERFIAARRVPDPDGSLPSITVVQNWFSEFASKR